MNEDEQKRLEAEGVASGTTTMQPQQPAPSLQPAPAPVGAGVDAFDAASKAGANMVGSAIDAAVAPGQSVVDAARNAETESELRGVAQAVTAADRYKATQSGMESPPSAWAQDVNDLYAGLTRAAQRSAERLAQPQQETAAVPNNEPKPITVGKDGSVQIGAAPERTAFGESFTAADVMNRSASSARTKVEQQVDSFFQ